MTNPTSDSVADDAQLKLDTDVESFIDKIRAGEPGEHTIVEVGLTGYTVERIDLEREVGESIQDWIRHAIDERLVEAGADIATTDDLEGRPADVGYDNDTPTEEIFRRLDGAGRRESAPVAIELPGGVVEAIHDLESRAEPSVAAWIRSAVWMRFSNIDAVLQRKAIVEIEVPEEIAVRARLRAEHRAHRRGADYDDALMDSLNSLAPPHPEYVLEGGDVLATYRDEDS